MTTSGGATLTYDARGNMTNDGTKAYGYDLENMLVSAPGATLAYDPALRLYQVTGAATTRFLYDGPDLIAETNGSNVVQRRYVHGPGADEPLVWYEGTGTSDRRFLHADERGSIVAVSNGAGTVTSVDTYDEYGRPGAANVGRFQYTGQKWIAEAGLYDYKARMYNPTLGRFMQADPIGYGSGMNLYAYVRGDPVNLTDPSGLFFEPYNWNVLPRADPVRIEGGIVTGHRCDVIDCNAADRIGVISTGGPVWRPREHGGGSAPNPCAGLPPELCPIVTARRPRRLPKLTPTALYGHYLHGRGHPICLTMQQLRQALGSASAVGRRAPQPGGGYSQLYQFGGGLALGLGRATLTFDDTGGIIGFRDTYNYNPRPFSGPESRGVVKELLTRMGDLDRAAGFAEPYEISLC